MNTRHKTQDTRHNSWVNAKLMALILASFLLFTFQGCKKLDDPNDSFPGKGMTSKTTSNSLLFHDMLAFSDVEEFNEYVNRLNLTSESDLDQYLAEIGVGEESLDLMSPQELEDLDVLINDEYNVFGVYEAFEQDLGFNSLRMKFAPLLNSWMQAGGDGADPMEMFPYPFAMMTLLNPFQEVKVGNAIIKFDVSEGIAAIITDGDYNTVLDLREDIHEAENFPNVIVYDNKSTKPCRTLRNDDDFIDYSKGGKNFRLKTYCGITPLYANAITQNFRRLNSGALVWSLCQMRNTLFYYELYNNAKCNAPSESGVRSNNNGAFKNRSRLEIFSFTGNGWLNIHAPSQKVLSRSERKNPNLEITVYAW